MQASEEENCFTATLLKHMRPSLKSLRPSGSECGSYLAEPVPSVDIYKQDTSYVFVCLCARIYKPFAQACVIITYPACMFATSNQPGECRTATVGGWELSWTLWLLWMLERRDVITVTAVGFAITHRWSMICQKRILVCMFSGKKKKRREC